MGWVGEWVDGYMGEWIEESKFTVMLVAIVAALLLLPLQTLLQLF